MSHGILRARGFDRTRFLAALLAAALLSASSAFAQITTLEEVPVITEDEEEGVPWLLYGISAFGSLGAFTMEDLNSAVSIVNSEIATQGSYGVRYESFESGSSVGGGLRAIMAERWLLSVDYERIIKSNKVGGVTSESQIRIPANVWSATLGYDLLSSPKARLGFAAGIGRYSSKAEQVITETLAGDEERELGRIKMEGDTLGQHYQMFFETQFTDHIFVSLFGGYRVAVIDQLEISGLDELLDPVSTTAFVSIPVVEERDGELLLRGGGSELDWSGFTGRVAFTYYINVPLAF
jgi:hypothetical protein